MNRHVTAEKPLPHGPLSFHFCLAALLLLSCAGCSSESSADDPAQALPGLWENGSRSYARFGEDGTFVFYESRMTPFPPGPLDSYSVLTIGEELTARYRLSDSEPDIIELSETGSWEEPSRLRYELADGELTLRLRDAKNPYHKASEAEKRFFRNWSEDGEHHDIELAVSLYEAVREDDTDRALRLLERGVNPIVAKSGSQVSRSAVHAAATNENIELISAFLDAGAIPPYYFPGLIRGGKKKSMWYLLDEVPSATSVRTLILTIEVGWLDMAGELVDRGVTNDRALMLAASKGHESITRRLLETRVGFPEAFREAAEQAEDGGHPEVAEIIWQEMDTVRDKVAKGFGESDVLPAHNEKRSEENLKALAWSDELARRAEELVACEEPMEPMEEVGVETANVASGAYFKLEDLGTRYSKGALRNWIDCEGLGRDCRSAQLVYSPENRSLGCALDLCELPRGSWALNEDFVQLVCLYGA